MKSEADTYEKVLEHTLSPVGCGVEIGQLPSAKFEQLILIATNIMIPNSRSIAVISDFLFHDMHWLRNFITSYCIAEVFATCPPLQLAVRSKVDC